MEIGSSSAGVVRYRGFYMLLDPFKEFGEIPSLFDENFSQVIGCHVTFRDPVGNIVKAILHKMSDSVANFTHGWIEMVDIYNLRSGGWVKFYYVGDSIFNISV